MRKYRHTKQQLRRIVPQKDLRAPIKIDLGWTTGDAMRQFSWGIRNSYWLISSNVTNTKWKEFRDDSKINQRLMSNTSLRTKIPLRGRQCNEHK